jgi:SAM-dependent methyltransferase
LKHYNELPKYGIWFDIAIIPFKEGKIAKSTSPIKLYEYMAMNKPVVVTVDLRECYRYKGILIANDKKEFIEKIEEALMLKDDPSYLKLLDEQARENTWKARAIMIDDYIRKYRGSPFIAKGLTPQEGRLNVWDLAQKGEKDFWVHVSQIGYAGYSPDEFISVLQRNSMLQALSFLEKPEEYWLDKVVMEVGSGPAGVVEYIRAKEKYAVEPLIDSYRQHYNHFSASDTKYFKQPVEKGIPLPDSFADLIICYNMLDHVLDPDQVIKECERVAKQGSYMLFQVNIYKDAILKKGQHKLLHPHTFNETSALEILEKNNFKAYKKKISEEPSDEGEYSFLIAARSTKL